MPSDFHLSIKNNQRKIVDVRDLFKDLTETEWKTLELAKERSELEKLRKEQNEALFYRHSIQVEQEIQKTNFQDSQNSSPFHLLQNNNENTKGVQYRNKPFKNDKIESKHYSMFMPDEPDLSNKLGKEFYDRCLSHSNVNDDIQLNRNNYRHHYNIIQRVSKKRPPRPKTLNSSSTDTSTELSTSNSSNNSSPIKTKVIRIHSKVLPKVSPRPRTQCPPNIAEENYERRHFSEIKNKVKNFLVVDKKFAKFKFSQQVSTSKPFYQNAQVNSKPMPNSNVKMNQHQNYAPDLYKAAEPIFYDYNTNVPTKTNNNSKIHVNNESCQFGRYQTNIIQSQPRQQYYQNNFHQQEQIYMPNRQQQQQQTNTPTIDRFSAFFHRTKNFRF